MSKIIKRILRSSALGVGALCSVNILAAFTGVSLGFGWLSGGVALLLGFPGVIGLLALNAIFLMG